MDPSRPRALLRSGPRAFRAIFVFHRGRRLSSEHGVAPFACRSERPGPGCPCRNADRRVCRIAAIRAGKGAATLARRWPTAHDPRNVIARSRDRPTIAQGGRTWATSAEPIRWTPRAPCSPSSMRTVSGAPTRDILPARSRSRTGAWRKSARHRRPDGSPRGQGLPRAAHDPRPRRGELSPYRRQGGRDDRISFWRVGRSSDCGPSLFGWEGTGAKPSLGG